MTTLDVQAPGQGTKARGLDDLDRVDVRGLLGAIAGRYRMILAAALGAMALLYLVTLLLPSTYTAFSKVMLDPREVRIMSTDEVVGNLTLSDPVIQTEISVLTSNILIERLIRDIGIDRLEEHYWGEVITDEDEAGRLTGLTWAIREDLTVYREGESFVFVISFDAGDPAMALEIANGVADTYITLQLESRRASARQATAWLQEQVDEARDAVNRAEEELAAFRAASLDRDGGTYETATQQLADLTAQAALVRSDRLAAEAQFNQLSTLLDQSGTDALAKAVTSPLLERLNDDRLTLERQDAQWAQSFGPDHPQRVRIRDEILRIEADLRAEAARIIALRKNDAEVARLREESLTKGIQELEDRIAAMSASSVELRQVEREAAAARENYDALLARLSNTSGQENLQRPEARVIERARLPDVPSAPRPKLMAAFGLILGLTGGVVAALFMEMTRTTFKTKREVEGETGLSVLAILPAEPQGDIRSIISALRENSNSLFGERIRQLRTLLSMKAGEAAGKVIAVTSSQPGEGKSTTALSLAQMAALAGKSVILVDGDLRRSKLASSFGWSMPHDFADFIFDDADLAEAVYTDDEMGVHVLAPSVPCPEAADDLSARWLKPMMAELARVYDVVIVDTPPLLNVADGMMLASVADSIVYVIRWNDTRRSTVADGLAALRELGRTPDGVVLSQVDPGFAEKVYGDSYAASY